MLGTMQGRSKVACTARAADGREAPTQSWPEISGNPCHNPALNRGPRDSAAQVFRLSFGPKSFVVVSDAAVARHMLMTNATNYSKGILSEILDFIMGSGDPPLLLCGSQQ